MTGNKFIHKYIHRIVGRSSINKVYTNCILQHAVATDLMADVVTGMATAIHIHTVRATLWVADRDREVRVESAAEAFA